MSEYAIEVNGLGKQYQLGGNGVSDDSFRELITDALGRLFSRRNMKQAKPDNSFWALRDIDLKIKRGEVIGVIGRNGSGKSTLLKILSRITGPTEGQAILRGRLSSLLEVGTGFHPELTGRENIYLNGSILGMRKPEIDAQFDNIVEFSGVDQFLDTPVKRYSSGMYVRLAFAVAAHLDPEILLIDEVLAVGDAAFQKKCLGKMRQVARGGRTVIFVSHNMGTIEQLCDRAILLEQGQLIAQGDTDHVIAEYMKLFGDGQNNPYQRSEEHTTKSPVSIAYAATVDQDNAPTTCIPGNQPVKVQFAFDVNDLPLGIRLDAVLRDYVGRYVFAYKTELQQHVQQIGSGKITGEFEIPAGYLVAGKYHMQFTIHVPRTKIYEDLTGVCSFHVTKGDTAIGIYGGEDYGCVNPPSPLTFSTTDSALTLKKSA